MTTEKKSISNNTNYLILQFQKRWLGFYLNLRQTESTFKLQSGAGDLEDQSLYKMG